jgi:phosphoribosyl 1,2-cyclic phosphate phosphodiesterase
MDLQTHSKNAFQPFRTCGLEITLFPVNHPPMETYGLLIRDHDIRIGYTSDTNDCIPEESLSLLEDLDLLFIDALVPPEWKIPQHMNYQEAVSLAGRLRAVNFRCVHMSHHIPFDLAHTGRDGERFSFPD